MVSTRQVEIYQDPTPFAQAGTAATLQHHSFDMQFMHDPSGSTSPVTQQTIAKRPSVRPVRRAPLKSLGIANSANVGLGDAHCVPVLMPEPSNHNFQRESPTKGPLADVYPLMAPQKPLQAFFTSFPSAAGAEKENVAPSNQSDNVADFPDPSYAYNASLKRPFTSSQASNTTSKKKARVDAPPIELPDPKNLPSLEDDGNKPHYSYAMLIGMSILRSPGRKLTLAQIYKWIADNFAFYRTSGDTGWQNSIRHNLSLNKAFIKQERPKDDPGKGNYWAILPGLESQFMYKEKGTRRPPSAGHKSLSGQQLALNAHGHPSQLPNQPKARPRAKPSLNEPSSDATVSASEAVSPSEETTNQPHSLTLNGSPSSPVPEVRSSPPVAPNLQERTPSPLHDLSLPAQNQAPSQKANFAEADDSGYFSCLDSSATRPYPDPKLPRFDANRHSIKRGRAEEEIARIRSSSHDISPSRSRSLMKHHTPSLVSSSPLRSLDTALMLPPLTPALNVRRTIKPPPSVSPNTNLRNHRRKIRELVGSPGAHLSQAAECPTTYSPAFKISDDGHAVGDAEEYCSKMGFPIGRTIQHSPFNTSRRKSEHARRLSDILADITGSANKAPRTSTPPVFCVESPLRQKSNRSPLRFGRTIDDIAKDDFFDLQLAADEVNDEIIGLDIFRGFSKIGSNPCPTDSPQSTARPRLSNRSHTSLF